MGGQGNGNQASTSSEATLFEINEVELPKSYHTFLFFNGITEGDEIIYRVYVYDVNSAAYSLYWERPANWNTLNLGKERAIRIPWVTTTNFKVTIEKTLGSNSTVRWVWVQTDIPL